MKPAMFDYTRPGTVTAAVEALASTADDARILAGGQSLVPLMNLRLAAPALVVDINRIGELGSVQQVDGGISIGAIARQADVEASQVVARACPLLVDALHQVGHPQLRNRGTVVGCLAHHDPAGELPAVALALGGRLTLRSPGGVRSVDAADFFVTHFTTAVEPGELVTHAWFPAQQPGTGSAFVELARRKGDFAIVGVAASLRVVEGLVAAASVAVSGMADRPVQCSTAESEVVGRAPTAETFARAGSAAATEDGLAPSDDVHATAEYRSAVLPVLVEAALAKSATRVK